MKFDFTSRLEPLQDYVPPVLYQLIVQYVGNELLPRKILPLRSNILCVGNEKVYWMRGFDIMCNDEPIIHGFFLIPKRAHYVNDKWLILDHTAVNLETKTWRTINEDATIEVHNGNVYLLYEWSVDIFDLDKWKGAVCYMGYKLSHLNVIGDCVSVVAQNCKTLLVDDRFLVNDHLVMKANAAVLYRWKNQIFKIGLFDLWVEKTKLYHFSSSVATHFAFQNFIFLQCQNRESFVYDIDTDTMQQIVGDTEYRYTSKALYSISDHIYLY